MQRAHIRAFSQVIACDIQPLQNTGPLNRLRTLGADEAAVTEWIRAAMRDGFSACEALIARTGGVFCFGDTPTLADVCLVPQLYNARRHSLDLTPFARLVAADAACARLDAFRSAAPEAQPDAE